MKRAAAGWQSCMQPLRAFLAAFLILMTPLAEAKKDPPPDTIYVNGDIYAGAWRGGTGEVEFPTPLPPLQEQMEKVEAYHRVKVHRVEAMAVRGDRIVAIGSNEEIRRLKGPETEVVDLGGHFVMPGFNDAHAHLAAGGLEMLRIDLVGVKSLAEMQQRIAERAKATAAGEWLIGRGWDQTLWAKSELPTRRDLDAVTAGHPAFFQRVDGHIAVMNTAALQAMGITRDTPNPPGGSIDRDAQGEPTGIVRDVAKDQVQERLPAPTLEQRRRGIELALAEAARWGVTSIQDSITVENDPREWDEFLVYDQLEREGKLMARITKWLPLSAPLDVLEAHRDHHPASDLMLHTGMLKGYLDGSLGSRTAALLQPYSDDPKNSGLLYHDQAWLDRTVTERARAGFQIGLHAIGDRAVQEALDAYAAAERDARANHWSRDFRFRIEHDQVVAPGQFKQYRDLGVIASVQPCHLLTDMRWAEARLGPERAKISYPWKQFAKAGVPLAFGTDFAVEPLNPFRNLYAAVTRQDEPGKQAYYPAQRLTIDEAVADYTWGSAYAEFEEKDKGLLARGYLADFVVLDRDITRVSPAEILGTKVLRTVVGGRTVYEAK